MFVAALFTVAKRYSHIKVHHKMTREAEGGAYVQCNTIQPLKRKENLTHAATQIDLEVVTLSETSQTQKDKCVRYCLNSVCRVPTLPETEGRVVLPGDWELGWGKCGVTEWSFNDYRVSVWEDERALELDGGDSFATV